MAYRLSRRFFQEYSTSKLVCVGDYVRRIIDQKRLKSFVSSGVRVASRECESEMLCDVLSFELPLAPPVRRLIRPRILSDTSDHLTALSQCRSSCGQVSCTFRAVYGTRWDTFFFEGCHVI